jgi:AsmA family
VRDVLTGIAILLLVVLATAMGLPHLIDWKVHRERIAQSLSEALGTKVTVNGPISVTLLPVPRLKLTQVRLADQGFMSGDIMHIRAEASVPNLLRGELRLTSVLIAGANLIVDPAQTPTRLTTHSQSTALVSVGSLQIQQSAVSVAGAPSSQPPLLLIQTGDMEATSLSGPFKGSFSVVLNGRSQSVRFSTGALSAEGIRLRALLENEQASLRSEWDGTVAFSSDAPLFSGRVTASGISILEANERPVNLVWRMAGRTQVANGRAQVDDIDLTIGPADRQIGFKGAANVSLDATLKAEVKLQARQIDLDKLLADSTRGQTTVALREIIRSFRPEGFRSDDVLPFQASIQLTAQSMILGGEVLPAPEIGLSLAKGLVSLSRLAAQLPGNVLVDVIRRPDTDAGLPVAALSIEGADVSRFKAWFTGRAGQRAPRKAFSLKGEVVTDKEGFSVQNATATLDSMTLKGAARLTRTGQAPRIEGDVELRDFDLLTLPELLWPDDADPGPDLNLRVRGSALMLGRQQIDRLSVALRKQAGVISLSDAEISGPNGLRISGQMGVTNTAVRSEMILQTRNLEELLILAERLNPQAQVLGFLRARAREFEPVDVRMKLQPGSGRGQDVSVEGMIAQSRINLVAKLSETGQPDGPGSLTLTAENPKSNDLLRQLGATPLPLGDTGPAKLSIAGGWPRANDQSVPWAVNGSIAGATIKFEGRKTNDQEQPADGRIDVKARDIYPLASSLGITFPEIEPGQDFSLSAAIDLRGLRITLREFVLHSGTQKLGGEIAFDLQKFGRVAGQIRVGQLNANSLATLISGGDQPSSTASVWSPLPFQANIQPSLPGDLWIEADTLILPDGNVLSQPGFVFRFDRNLAYIEYGRGKFRDAPIELGATIRRTDKLVTLAGRISARRVNLADVANDNALKGLLSLDVEFNGAGDTALALASSLSGTGRGSMAEVAVSLPDPKRLLQLVASPPDDAQALVPHAILRQISEAPRASVQIPDRPLNVTFTGGVLRIGPAVAERDDADVALSMVADVRTLALSPVIATTLRRSPDRWSGPPPSFLLTLRSPARGGSQLDVTPLSNGLMALQIRKELDRIDVLEQDKRELENASRRLERSQSEERDLREARRRLELLRQEAAKEAALEAERQKNRAAPLSIVPPVR